MGRRQVISTTREQAHNLANSWQQPIDAEPGGGQWHKFEDPGTGWFATKVAGWTADQFTPGGLEVDFGPVKREGMRAVRVFIVIESAVEVALWRKSGDTNISNTPFASSEFSHELLWQGGSDRGQCVIWLSSDYKAQFAVTGVNADLYIAHPVEYLL